MKRIVNHAVQSNGKFGPNKTRRHLWTKSKAVFLTPNFPSVFHFQLQRCSSDQKREFGGELFLFQYDFLPPSSFTPSIHLCALSVCLTDVDLSLNRDGWRALLESQDRAKGRHNFALESQGRKRSLINSDETMEGVALVRSPLWRIDFYEDG